MNNKYYKILRGILLLPITCYLLPVMAQAPRTSFGMEGFNFAHEINPAMQADTSYWSVPILGNTSMGINSTMRLGDLLFDRNGKVTTFMNSGTISKADLMDKVGSGLNNTTDIRMTLISIGRRLSSTRYQTFALTWRTQEDLFLDKGLFDVMKEVENRPYSIANTTFEASSYMELAYGESRKLDEHWTVGGKAKLLLGIANADIHLKNMNIDLSTGKWIAQGNVTSSVSGLEYKNVTKEYKGKEGTYTMVNDMKVSSPSIRGLGVSIDAGATYKLDDHWTFSAALLDLGFLHWFNSHKAENSGKTFEFDGFHEVSADKDNPRSLSNQWNNIYDQLMDMAHLEETKSGSTTSILACTIDAGATYKYNRIFSASVLLTQRIHGLVYSFEGRLNLNAHRLIKNIDFTLSPAAGTYGFQLGGMFCWSPGPYQIYIASDNLLNKLTKQCLPTSLNTTLNFGMTLPL